LWPGFPAVHEAPRTRALGDRSLSEVLGTVGRDVPAHPGGGGLRLTPQVFVTCRTFGGSREGWGGRRRGETAGCQDVWDRFRLARMGRARWTRRARARVGRVRAPALLVRLPPPYRQVATLQGVLGGSRSAITDWLCAWRPISRQSCPGILRRTHEMLPFLVGPVSPRERWPRRTDPKKNPWFLPPPFSRL